MAHKITYYDKSGVNFYEISFFDVSPLIIKNERGDSIKVSTDCLSDQMFETLDKLFKQQYEVGYCAKNKGEWIKCTDRQPEKDGRYLVVENYPSGQWIGVCSLRNGKWDDMKISHWMELPRAPNE